LRPGAHQFLGAQKAPAGYLPASSF